MLRLHHPQISSLLIAVGLLSNSILSARANPVIKVPKVSVCVALLTQMSESHSVRGVSQSYTQEAIAKLREIRVQTLGQPLVDGPGTYADLEVSGRHATEEDRRRVASQIRGIELGLQVKNHETLDDEKEILLAQVIRDKEIENFLNELRSGSGRMSQSNSIVSVLFLYLHSSVLMTYLQSATSELSRTSADSGLIGSAAALALSLFLGGADRYLQYAKSQVWLPNLKWDQLIRSSQSGDENQWVYWATQTRPRTHELLSALRGEDEPLNWSHTRSHLSFLERAMYDSTKALVGRLIPKARPFLLFNETYLSIDLWAGPDPKTKEPLLIPVVRLSQSRPQPPPKKKNKLLDRLKVESEDPLLGQR